MDRRSRPWKKLRVVVEVSVPPTSRATEKDLLWHVQENMPTHVSLARAHHANAQTVPIRIKAFQPFYTAYRIMQKKLGK